MISTLWLWQVSFVILAAILQLGRPVQGAYYRDAGLLSVRKAALFRDPPYQDSGQLSAAGFSTAVPGAAEGFGLVEIGRGTQ